MDTKINLSIKKLIELDQKSVALEKEWDKQLIAMEQDFKQELENITNSLQVTKNEAKKIYEQLLEKAQEEAAALALDADQRLRLIEQNMTNAVDGLAKEMWDKIKDEIK